MLDPGDPLITRLHHLKTLLLCEARHELELRAITSNRPLRRPEALPGEEEPLCRR